MIFDAYQSFNFFPMPTDVHFGFGLVDTLADRVRALGARRVCIVTDPGVKAAGVLDRVLTGLRAESDDVIVFDGVTPDSGSALISEAARAAKAHHADVVLGVGGGSALDTAKAAATLVTNDGGPLDYVGLHRVKERPLPTIAVPTTAGTGSEVSLWSVFTDDATREKVAIGSLLLYPTVAVCDPELTLGLPPALTAATGMDALAHAIECYTNTACQPISGALALEAIGLLGQHLRTAVLNGRDRPARHAVMLGSTLAGMAMNPTRLGLAHAFAMPLGSGSLKIPHGVAVAVTLPHVMRFNALAAPTRFVEVAHALGETTGSASVRTSAYGAAEAVQQLGHDIGIPKGLATYGLTEHHIPSIVAAASTSGNVAVNPRQASAADLDRILRAAL